jgi:Response regulator containing a CheY-like receiver domain and an HTH DNA-binding domain
MVQITDRELAVFQMHNNCYSRNEIAKVLGISNQTVEYCLEKIKRRTGKK